MVEFEYKNGKRLKMRDSYAKILERARVGSVVQSAPTYQTREMRAADPQPSMPQQFTPDLEVDSEGQQWTPELHTANRQMTKDGRWRRKPGAAK